jgi:hypothetical protein
MSHDELIQVIEPRIPRPRQFETPINALRQKQTNGDNRRQTVDFFLLTIGLYFDMKVI